LVVALLAAACAVSTGGPAAADDGDGRTAFNNACRTCHTLTAGDNRLGPNLAGIIGRKAGSVEGYGFSSSLAGSNIVWDEATLDRFLADPNGTIPGNNMKPFTGIAAGEDRARIIRFLKSGG
jgi:cytochrome c